VATSQLKFPAALKSFYTFRLVGISHPENHYLYLAVTLGILGLLAFLSLVALVQVYVHIRDRRYRQRPSTPRR
jgi:O-antigen ligase